MTTLMATRTGEEEEINTSGKEGELDRESIEYRVYYKGKSVLVESNGD